MASKRPKSVFTTYPNENVTVANLVAGGLDRKFGSTGFKFTVTPSQTADTKAPCFAVVADGPWDLPANVRPAHGTLQTFAEGYAQGQRDAMGGDFN